MFLRSKNYYIMRQVIWLWIMDNGSWVWVLEKGKERQFLECSKLDWISIFILVIDERH